MQNGFSPKPRLRATVEQLVAEAAIGDPRAQQQLDEFARHPVIGRLIAEVLAEAEGALANTTRAMQNGTSVPYDKQLVSVREVPAEKHEQDQGSVPRNSEGVFCTPERARREAEAAARGPPPEVLPRWQPPVDPRQRELERLWKRLPGMIKAELEPELGGRGWKYILDHWMRSNESPQAFVRRVKHGSQAADTLREQFKRAEWENDPVRKSLGAHGGWMGR